jgi:tripartite-type tricarboxylate transporter receptor subunit TctC
VDLEIGIWRLIVAHAGTPASVIDLVRSAYVGAIRDPDFVKVAQGSQIVGLDARETVRVMDDYGRMMKKLADEFQLRSKR